MMKLKKISTNCLIAGALLLGTAAQAEMINLTATAQPDGTKSSSSSCPPGPSLNCVAPVADPFNTGASFSTAPGVTFYVDQLQPSGTGVLDPFLRIQRNDNEQGYNTSGRPLNYDAKNPLNYTHDLRIGDLEKVGAASDGTGGWFEFVLDIAENDSRTNSLLSLDGLRLYGTNVGGQTGEPPLFDGSGDWAGPTPGELLWEMDIVDRDSSDGTAATIDNAVLLDANRLDIDGNPNPPGNGVSDMRMQVDANIIEQGGYEFLILWSRFGLIAAPSGAGSFASFEEWAGRVCEDCGVGPPSFVPAPAPLVLLGLGMGMLGWTIRKSHT